MSTGWIKLHRKILDNAIFKNDKLFRVFMYLLLKAGHSEREQLLGDSIVQLKSGQWATGRKAISRDTGLTEQNVRTAITKLEKLGILTIKVTSKYSIFSIANWDNYQQDNQQVTKCQPTSNQQVTTIKNVKNDKNDKNIKKTKFSDLQQEAFDHFWDLYPKKVAKPSALKSFKAKTKGMKEDQLMEFTDLISFDSSKRFEKTEKQFIPNPSTYLNQERYEDE